MDEAIFEPLLKNKAAKIIFDRFQQIGHEIRFVGGAVRDCLAHRKIHDIDLATPLRPEAVMSELEEIGLRVIPTGIEHGTITVVMDNQSFEITTLRRDVSTDGRRAVVSYTHDWYEDACRRDFTFNAMSLKWDGTLYDPFAGASDLAKGRVVFIGEPEKRIDEDVLRILRFFRFHAFYGKDQPDPKGLQACKEKRGLLDRLSAERVRGEIFKLLKAQNAADIWRIMVEDAVLVSILPHAYYTDKLAKVIEIEKAAGIKDSFRRFLSLYRQDSIVVSDLAERLRLTKVEYARVGLYKKGVIPDFLSFDNAEAFPALLYHYGHAVLLDGLVINEASKRSSYASAEHIRETVHKIQKWQRPFFPLSGNDLMAHMGLEEGPELGRILKAAEEKWINHNFQCSREDLLIWARSKFLGQ